MISDREKLVLGAIIDYYLTYGDTIGSRTLVKKYEIQFSSATIRNVMADLEDMGYIAKTHTSSGRIPTDKGYKFYLDELIKIEKLSRLEREKIHRMYEDKMEEIESVLKRTSSLLSKLTSYAGIVMEPDIKRDNIKKVELVHINDYSALAVIVMENASVRTKKIHFENPLSCEELSDISNDLNSEIHKGEIAEHEVEEFIIEKSSPLLTNLSEELYSDLEGKFFIEGTNDIFANKTVEEAKEVLEVLSKRKNLRDIFEELAKSRPNKSGEANVIFGDELQIEALKDLSFVYSVYKVGNSQGVIGVVGPKRMAYSKTVGLVEYVTKEVDRAISDIEKKEK